MKVPVLGSLAEEGRGGGKIAPIMQDAFTNFHAALIYPPFHLTNFRPIRGDVKIPRLQPAVMNFDVSPHVCYGSGS